MTKNQFHHFIPRFILRNFIEEDGYKKTFVWKESEKAFSVMKKSHKNDNPRIKSYDFQNQQSGLPRVKKMYGIQNMYKDITSDYCMKFEELLGKLECSAAIFIQKIVSDTQEISLSRTQLESLKKFLVIMTYRGEGRRMQYTNNMFNLTTKHSIQRHMDFNNILSIQDVWFENLKWLLNTETHAIFIESLNVTTMDDLKTYKGPIHVTELSDFGHLITNYVCIWQAQEGSEFILTDNCFGSYEGAGPIVFHRFYVMSPKYAVVLVHREYMWDDMDKLPVRKSWFEDFHATPDVVYTKEINEPTDAMPTDIFKYKRIVVPKEKVWLVNSIFLDEGNKNMTYKSNASMYKSLALYDKLKATEFTNKYDYSVLKRKLFSEMNRTHDT
ncbi:hypothetical protein BGX27_008776 [Mortierella sp. AM989]|nr:hypothetical protein BGX27_008776 [Mortierella sp. AM989]